MNGDHKISVDLPFSLTNTKHFKRTGDNLFLKIENKNGSSRIFTDVKILKNKLNNYKEVLNDGNEWINWSVVKDILTNVR